MTKRNVDLQKARASSYTGNQKTNASHVISVKERTHFDLPNRNDNLSNYRNCRETTNKSVHTSIDNNLLERYSEKSSDKGTGLTTSSGTKIPKAQFAARIEQKIKVAKKTGDIHNPRYCNFLQNSSSDFNVDKRKFNGIT